MSQRIILLLAVLGFCLIPAAQAANIVLVNEAYDTDADGVQDDQGLIDWLVAEGHDVTIEPGSWVDLDPNKIAVLDAADLVIMSRSTNSGNYDDGDEPTLWNSVKAPLIQMSAYLVRSSRWKWVNSTSITNPVGAAVEAVDLESPVFRFVTLEPNNPDDPNDPAVLVQATDAAVGTGQTSVISTLDMGNGNLIAKAAGLDAAWIATWDADVEFYEGAGQAPAAKRMMFCAGTQEVGATPQGAFNLTAEGEQMLHNAINYMLGKSVVAWVSYHAADDEPHADAAAVGFTQAPDIGYTDLLKANGYDVVRVLTTQQPDVEYLNAFDLVIISRTASSGHYGGSGATLWNSITTPMINLNGYTLRNSRLGITDGGTMVDTVGDIQLAVTDPNHPIFAGIALTDGVMDNPYAEGAVPLPTDPNIISRGISVNNNTLDEEGTLLATVATADDPTVGGLIIAELPAGATLQNSSGSPEDVLGGPRLVFLTGSREPSGVTGGQAAALYDLYPDGEQMFLNAVAYMLIEPEAPADPLAEGLLLHYPFDEDASDASGNGNDGTLLGDAVILDGVLVLDGDDDAVDVPRLGGEDAVYSQCAISMWVFATADLTPMQFAGGINTNGWTDGAVHFKLSYGMVNAGINGLEGGDLQGVTPVMPAMWSHMVLNISETEVALYLNGQLEDSRVLEAPLEGLLLGGAALGAWNNGGDIQREMPGLMDEVRIYDRALSAEEIAELGSM